MECKDRWNPLHKTAGVRIMHKTADHRPPKRLRRTDNVDSEAGDDRISTLSCTISSLPLEQCASLSAVSREWSRLFPTCSQRVYAMKRLRRRPLHKTAGVELHKTADHRLLKRLRRTDNVDSRPLKRTRGRFTADDPVHEAGEDRISSLPDDILLCIMSSLPLEQWGSFSAVSRTWRRLTRLLPRRDSCYKSCFNEPPRFPRAFVRRLHLVNSLREDVIQHAMDAAVEELVIEDEDNFDIVGLPRVFHIRTLRVLQIKRCRPLRDACSKKLGCTLLRTLTIERCLVRKGVIKGILACCRRLETLHLLHCVGTESVVIRSESLKNLWLCPGEIVKRLSIHAPNLEVLILRLQWIAFFELNIQAPKVKETRLDVSNLLHVAPAMGRFIPFLLAAKELTSFTLNAAAAKYLLAAKWLELETFSVTFEKMKLLQISLDIKNQAKAAMFLVKLLEKCPGLSQLNLQVVQEKTIKSITNFTMLREKLKRLECLPHCLQNVNLDLLVCTPFEVELVRVFFRRATMLKRFELVYSPGWHEKKAIESILSLRAPQKEESFLDHNGRHTIKMEF